MIITVDDIRKYRDIAANTRQDRVEIFIRETEQLDIVPLLGVTEYDRLSEVQGTVRQFVLGRSVLGLDVLVSSGFVLGSGVLGHNVLGEGPEPGPVLTPEEKKLLEGGSWLDDCGCWHRFEGLKAAISYLTFARFIRNHPLQVTPYGVVVKEADDSSPASAQSVASVSKDSEKIGRQYLADAVTYWRSVSERCGQCQKPVRASKKKFFALGD